MGQFGKMRCGGEIKINRVGRERRTGEILNVDSSKHEQKSADTKTQPAHLLCARSSDGRSTLPLWLGSK